MIAALALTALAGPPIQCSKTLFPNVTCPASAHGCVEMMVGKPRHRTPRPSNLRNGYPWGCNVSSVSSPGKFSTCDLGAPHPLSTTRKNVLIIGDSVSNGYFQEGIPGQNVPDLLSSVAYSSHAPYSPGSGGAGPTSHGLDCLEIYLKLATGAPAKYDAISFNFGLHDLGNTTANLASYDKQLTAIADRLVKTGSKLLYLDTTPMMPNCCQGAPLLPPTEGAPPPKCKEGTSNTYLCDTVVLKLNIIAKKIMAARKITYVDLHQTVTAVCAPQPPHDYVNCSLCRMEPCSFHYNAAGYGPIAKAVAAAFKKALL